MSKHRRLSRRDFLKLAGAGVGGAILACGKGTDIVTDPGSGVTQVPGVSISPVPVVTQGAGAFEPGTLADLILTNGNVLTVDSGQYSRAGGGCRGG